MKDTTPNTRQWVRYLGCIKAPLHAVGKPQHSGNFEQLPAFLYMRRYVMQVTCIKHHINTIYPRLSCLSWTPTLTCLCRDKFSLIYS